MIARPFRVTAATPILRLRRRLQFSAARRKTQQAQARGQQSVSFWLGNRRNVGGQLYFGDGKAVVKILCKPAPKISQSHGISTQRVQSAAQQAHRIIAKVNRATGAVARAGKALYVVIDFHRPAG